MKRAKMLFSGPILKQQEKHMTAYVNMHGADEMCCGRRRFKRIFPRNNLTRERLCIVQKDGLTQLKGKENKGDDTLDLKKTDTKRSFTVHREARKTTDRK